jgi:putative endonuclease
MCAEFATIPGLQRITPLRFVLHCARETTLVAPMPNRYFVYILANRPKGVLYVGVTSDLPQRVWQHKTKVVPGFTTRYGVTRLVYYEEHGSILEARERERALKRWRRAWKFKLIEDVNSDWRDLSDELVML